MIFQLNHRIWCLKKRIGNFLDWKIGTKFEKLWIWKITYHFLYKSKIHPNLSHILPNFKIQTNCRNITVMKWSYAGSSDAAARSTLVIGNDDWIELNWIPHTFVANVWEPWQDFDSTGFTVCYFITQVRKSVQRQGLP